MTNTQTHKPKTIEERLDRQELLMKQMLIRIQRIDKQLKLELILRWVRYGILIILIFTGALYLTPYIVGVYETYLGIAQKAAEIGGGSLFDILK